MNSKPKDVRPALEQLINNPACDKNVVSAALRTPLSVLTNRMGIEKGWGTSNFATTRGKTFESFITRPFKNGASPVEREMAKKGLIPEGENSVIENLRRPSAKESLAKSAEFLRDLVTHKIGPLAIATGFKFETDLIPPTRGTVELDLLVCHWMPETKKWAIRVGEAKTYPDRSGLTDPFQLATARAQAGLYCYLLRNLVSSDPELTNLEVQDKAILVLSKTTGNWPSVWVEEDLSELVLRSKNAIGLMQKAITTHPILQVLESPESSQTAMELLEEAKTNYDENCWVFCPLAESCYRILVASDDVLMLGTEAKELLGKRQVEEVQQLLLEDKLNLSEADIELRERLDDAKFR